MRTLRRPGWRRPYGARPFPFPLDPQRPAPVGEEEGDPEDAMSRGKEGVGTRSLHLCPTPRFPRALALAPKPVEGRRPISAAAGPRRPARDQPEAGPAGADRGDARQKAAGRRRGGACPGTPTRTRPAGGAERRAATLAPAWPRRPALLLPTAERPALPSRRPATEGANARGHPSPRRLPSPRPYNPPRRPAPALPPRPRPRPPSCTRLSARACLAPPKGLRG